MKKILTILAVALLSTATVFAAVNFSGSTTVGYQFNYGDTPDAWTQAFYGDDGDDTNPSTLKATVSDEEGIWSITLKAGVTEDGDVKGATFADTGSMAGNVTVNVAKLAGLDDFTLTAGVVANDRFTPSRAYSNQSGKNFDRVRTYNGSGYVATLSIGYGGYFVAQVAADPGLNPKANDDDIKSEAEVLASAIVTPVDGVEVSASWALKGNDGDNRRNGLVGVAFDANIGKIADLDFTIGLSGAWRYDIEPKTSDFAVTVYGGIDEVDLAVEFAYTRAEDLYLYVGAGLNFFESFPIEVYFGANDLAAFGDEFFVGGNVGYKVAGMALNLGIEYSAGGSYNYDYNGFNIVPSVSFSW